MKTIPRSRLNFSLSQKSFTLIELIMTIVVIGMIAIPLSLLLSQHIRSVFQSQDYTLALNLARLEMENVNSMDYTSITDASFVNYEGYNYTLNRTVTYIRGDAGSQESLKKVLVELQKSGSSAALVSLVTYIAKNLTYGL